MKVEYNLNYKITYIKPDGSHADVGETWFEECNDIDDARSKTERRLNAKRKEVLGQGFDIYTTEGTYQN